MSILHAAHAKGANAIAHALRGALVIALLGVACLGGVLLGGCDRPIIQDDRQMSGVDEYGKLPGLRATPNRQLRDELSRIVAERGTPELLDETTIEPDDNVAVALVDLFAASRIRPILDEAENIFPEGPFQFNPSRLQRAIGFRKRFEKEWLRARDALYRPQCKFDLAFTAGLTADLKFIDTVWICVRLEAFYAAEALATTNSPDHAPGRSPDLAIDQAIESLTFMLRLAHWLGDERHLVCRLEAAYMRTVCFGLLQAIVAHPELRRAQVERLGGIVRSQLDDWPDDANAWIGERALGMHAYEMVRDGRLSQWLTSDELDAFGEEINASDLAMAAQRNANNDELYYLETMRATINACRQPYYDRLASLHALEDDLAQRRQEADYPFVAARVLLKGIAQRQAVQAEDRANWEAWDIALALANGQMPRYEIAPITGKPYVYTVDNGKIVVSHFDSNAGDERQIVVPHGDTLD